jgi:hypothetical protein
MSGTSRRNHAPFEWIKVSWIIKTAKLFSPHSQGIPSRVGRAFRANLESGLTVASVAKKPYPV